MALRDVRLGCHGYCKHPACDLSGVTGRWSPGGSWQWLLLHVVSWIICVESQVKTPINKSAGGEGIGYEVRRPDGLAHRTVLTRILQAPPTLRHGVQAGRGRSAMLIAGTRMPLA